MSNTLAIGIRGLTRTFGPVRAVNGIDLDIQQKQLFGIVGPDAAGKTTLMRMLVGVLAPTEGTISVLGHDLFAERQATRLLVGYMSQAFSLYQDLTVQENIRFFAALRGVSRADRDERSQRLLEATGLAPFTKRYAGKLSGGMKQKLGLVCTLVHEPKILLLDEPTNGVDPVSRREFWSILGELRERITVVITTPSLDEAERCDRVAMMTDGNLLTVDTPDALRDRVTTPVWEVQTDQPFKAAEVLKESLPGASVQLFGDRVHVVHDAPAAQLVSLLTTAALPATVERVPPSLEDAYVQLVTGGDP